MRTANRVAGTVLGVVLLGLGLVTVIEAVALLAWNRAWPAPVLDWRDTLRTVRWSDTWVLVASIAALVLGLLILAGQLRRFRSPVLGTAWSGEEDTWMLQRRTVTRHAETAAKGIRGVDRAHAATSGSAERWQLDLTADTRGDVVDPEDIEAAVARELRTLGAPEDVPVRVRLRRTAVRA